MTIRPSSRAPGLVRVELPLGADWYAFCTLYEEVFPAAKREPLVRIAQRVAAGRYQLTLLRFVDEPAAGFHLLDRVAALDYMMLTFLALHPGYRGRGWGQWLLQDAVCRFHASSDTGWLLVEAEPCLARFYQGCGFRRLALDYRVPYYGDAAAMQTLALLALHRDGRSFCPDGQWLRWVIEHLFVDGYQVRQDDPRLTEQLQRLPDIVGVL